MFQRILDALATLPSAWAYVLLFLFNFIETAAFVGFVVPGESVVLICGFLASRGVLRLEWVIALASLGAILGDSVGFWIGRRYGATVFLRFGRYVRIQSHHLEEAQRFFARHGGKTVFLGRFTAWLRAMTPMAAGLSNMHYRPFLLYNVTGGIVWASTFSLVGYFAGQSWELLGSWIGRAGLALFILVMSSLYLASLLRRKKRVFRVLLGKMDRLLTRELPGLWPPLRSRFAPGAWQGMQLTLSLGLLLLSCYAFVEIVEIWVGKASLDYLDAQAQQWMTHLRAPWLTAVMKSITLLGWSAVPIVVLCTVVVLWVKGKKQELYTWFIVLAGGGVLLNVLKLMFHRARPTPEFVLAHGYSFPSGHATAAVLVYGYLSLLVWQSPVKSGWRVMACGGLMLLILLIGMSRVYLNVHYLTDVLAGYILGGTWMLLVLLIFRVLHQFHPIGKTTL